MVFKSFEPHKAIHFQVPDSKLNVMITNMPRSVQNQANYHNTSCLHSLKLFTLKLSPKFCLPAQLLSFSYGFNPLQPHNAIHFQISHSNLNAVMLNLSRSMEDEANYHSTRCLHPLKLRYFSG